MSEWKKVKIGDVCKIVKGTTGIASAKPGEYPLVVTAAERKTCSDYQFDCEAVCIPLVSSSGHGKKSLNNVHYQSGKFALGTILCAVIPNDPKELDARYLHQYLQFYKDTVLVPLMKGAANVSLSMKDIASVEIPLPPIERQRELSAMFISLQEKSQQLRAESEKQIEYAKQLRANVLQDAIEGKLTVDWREKHPVKKGDPNYDAEALFEKIQNNQTVKNSKVRSSNNIQEKMDDEFELDIPKTWIFVKLSELGILERGRSKHRPRNDERLFKNGKYPLVQTGDVSQSKNFGYEIQPVTKFYNEFGLSQSKIWKAGTLCITIAANIAETGFLTYDACFPDSVVGFIPFLEGSFSTFVRYYIDSIKLILEKYAPATAQKNINLGILETLKIPLPPLVEQNEIVVRVEKHLETITQLETQIATRETTTKQLMQSILKDAFVG